MKQTRCDLRPPYFEVPSGVFVHMLNDQGAKLLGDEKYDEAIDVLVQALKLWEQLADDHTCQCRHCSLEACIIQTLPDASSLTKQGSSRHSLLQLSRCQRIEDPFVHDIEMEARFIYRIPIYASPTFACSGHSPGIILSLVIILNLAMAHHLSAIQHGYCRKRLQKALHLYELAHQLQLDEKIYSPRGIMIIANNVGEIHQAVQNYDKHAICLQQLLSTMMYMIDGRIPKNSIELEGFFRNTAQLILHNNCAGAA